jgi:hypothetical protein
MWEQTWVHRFWLRFLPAPGLACSEKALGLNGRRAGCGLSPEAEQVQSEHAVREKSVCAAAGRWSRTGGSRRGRTSNAESILKSSCAIEHGADLSPSDRACLPASAGANTDRLSCMPRSKGSVAGFAFCCHVDAVAQTYSTCAGRHPAARLP